MDHRLEWRVERPFGSLIPLSWDGPIAARPFSVVQINLIGEEVLHSRSSIRA